MTPAEFDAWKQWTRESAHRWVVDPIHDGRDDRDLLLYIGGENGKFLRFDNAKTLEIGSYEGAVPHIGEATFRVDGRMKFRSRILAVFRATEIAGMAFIHALPDSSGDHGSE